LRGYETAGVSANYLTSHRRGFSQGHDYYWQKNNKVAFKSALFKKLIPERWWDLLVRRLHFLYSGAPQINSEAGDWLNRRDASRPFYLFLHYMDVHYPYYVYKDDPENDRQFRETTRHQRRVEGIELTTEDLEALKALGYH
jgi:hypothetical protein